MNSTGTCSKCGARLPARSASSFCPACLLQEIGQPRPTDDAISEATAGPQSGLTVRVEPAETLGGMIGRYKHLALCRIRKASRTSFSMVVGE